MEPLMTLEEFAKKFKALLKEAQDSGLDIEEFCQITENILETGWRNHDPA